MAKKNKKKAARGFLKGYAEFIKKGNIIDLAVAVVIGSTFNAIVNSLVKDIIMPSVAMLFGKNSFKDWTYVYSEDIIINYGNFINTIFQFIIISFSIYFVLKVLIRNDVNKKLKEKIDGLKKKIDEKVENEEEKPQVVEEVVPQTPQKTETELLQEIIDLIKNQNSPDKK